MPGRPVDIACAVSALLMVAAAVRAADWPQWGGRNERNFASDEKGIPERFFPKTSGNEKKGIPPTEALNIKWVASLGSQTYGNPAVAGGRVFIGTNDASLSDPRLKKTRGGLIMCLEEATGKRLWQLAVPALRTRDKNFNYDNISLGICSAPTVDGDRVYVTSSRGEVLCLDVRGQADGNDGPYTGEGVYMVDNREFPGKPGRFDEKDAPPPPAPVAVEPGDGDIIWCYDLLRELDVWPQDAVDCSVLVYGEYVYVCTSNGMDKSHRNIPSPNAPDLIVLDKKTGRLVAVNDPPIGKAIFHGEWSSPSLGWAGDKPLILFGGGDGFCYAFDPTPEERGGGKPGVLRQVWKFDCNPPHNKLRDGQPLLYNKNAAGPSEIIGTPVFVGGRIYVTVGQDSRHGPGPGCFSCIDPTKSGDVTESGRLWQYFDLGRSFSTPSVVGDLVFIVDYKGIVHCVDAGTGRPHWTHDLKARVWGSTFAVNGKVLIGDEEGKMTVFACSREKKVLAEVRFEVPVYATPVAANGVLLVATQTHLYAISEGGK